VFGEWRIASRNTIVSEECASVIRETCSGSAELQGYPTSVCMASIRAASNMTLRPEILRLSKLMLSPLHPISADGNVLWPIIHPASRPCHRAKLESSSRAVIAICRSPLAGCSEKRKVPWMCLLSSGLIDQSLGLSVLEYAGDYCSVRRVAV
jgi:hypothetical protein